MALQGFSNGMPEQPDMHSTIFNVAVMHGGTTTYNAMQKLYLEACFWIYNRAMAHAACSEPTVSHIAKAAFICAGCWCKALTRHVSAGCAAAGFMQGVLICVLPQRAVPGLAARSSEPLRQCEVLFLLLLSGGGAG